MLRDRTYNSKKKLQLIDTATGRVIEDDLTSDAVLLLLPLPLGHMIVSVPRQEAA